MPNSKAHEKQIRYLRLADMHAIFPCSNPHLKSTYPRLESRSLCVSTGSRRGSLGVVLLEGHDEIRVDQDPAGRQESVDLPVDGFEGVDAAEIVQGLEG